MARLRIRAIRLRASTDSGEFGALMTFGDGLTIIRAENNAGKTTILSAILYGLGLEGMVGPSHRPPFAEALTGRLFDESTGEWLDVQESSVAVEIESQHGARACATRSVRLRGEPAHANSPKLISVSSGPELTAPTGSFERRDYFVRIDGAVQRDDGFHRFLADFIGLELPLVSRFDGDPVPLYLEAIFPFFFVEQLTGWRGIHARMPSHFKIQNLWERAFEYVAQLDLLATSLRRNELAMTRERIRAAWRMKLIEVEALTSQQGVSVAGLWHSPGRSAEHGSPYLVVGSGTQVVPLAWHVAELQKRLEEELASPIPSSEDAANHAATQLKDAELRLGELERQLSDLVRVSATERGNIATVDRRLDGLREDLRRYKDEKRLREMGSRLPRPYVSSRCPTCDQPTRDMLLPQHVPLVPMDLSANIAFIEGQIDLFAHIRQEIASSIAEQQLVFASMSRQADEVRGSVRELKRTLRADADAPSSEAIRRRVVNEEDVARLKRVEAAFSAALDELSRLEQSWQQTEAELKELKSQETADSDEEKLDRIQAAFLEQLHEYGFSSLKTDELAISRQSYRPIKDGYDIGGMSASDNIRTIWAYLISILELSRRASTNHIGILVLDEPQQQNVKDLSFSALLRRAAFSSHWKQQVIFASSEKVDVLADLVHNIPCAVIELGNFVLQRVQHVL